MTSPFIRHAQAQDEAQWRVLWGDYTKLYAAPKITEEITAHTWAQIMDSQNTLNCLVAEENGVIQGFIHYVTHPRAWSIHDSCYMEDLFVGIEYRRKGIARRLCAYLRAFCVDKNISRIYWNTEENNTAQKLYDQIGWKDSFVRYLIILS